MVLLLAVCILGVGVAMGCELGAVGAGHGCQETARAAAACTAAAVVAAVVRVGRRGEEPCL